MPIDTHPKRKPPTPEQIIAEQRRQAATARQPASRPQPAATHDAAAATPPASVPAISRTSTPATTAVDTRSAVERYIEEVAPSSIVGRLIKFSKDGRFVTADDGEPIADDIDFFALCGETQVGWIKFADEEGEPPERHVGLLYDGFRMPARESLGDLDEAEWPAGLSGDPQDPWQHQQNLVLQQTATRELFTFSTSSKTGRRAVGALLRHYNRMQRMTPDDVPVVRLKAGGFQHKDDRIGWVTTPLFAVVGRVPRDDAAKPETPLPDTSPAGDMNDVIQF